MRFVTRHLLALVALLAACRCGEPETPPLPQLVAVSTVAPFDGYRAGAVSALADGGLVVRYDPVRDDGMSILRILAPDGAIRFSLASFNGAALDVDRAGKFVALADPSGTSFVDVARNVRHLRIEGLRRPSALAFTPDGSFAIDVDRRGRTRWLDPVGATVRAVVETDLAEASRLSFSGEGDVVEVSSSARACRIVAPAGTVSCRDEPRAKDEVVSPGGTHRAEARPDGSIALVEVEGGAVLAEWRPSSPGVAASSWSFAATGTELFVSLADGAVERVPLLGPWAVAVPVPAQAVLPTPEPRAPRTADPMLVAEAAFFPFGSVDWVASARETLVVAAGAAHETIDATTGARSGAFAPPEAPAVLVAPVRGGFAHGHKDGSLQLSRAEPSHPVRAHEGPVVALATAPDGVTVATGDEAGAVRLWQTADLKPSMNSEFSLGSRVTGLAFAPDGRTLYASGARGSLVRWDLRKKQSEPVGAVSEAAALALDVRGSRLAIARTGGVDVIETRGGKVVASFVRHGEAVVSLAWSRDGKTLAGAVPEGAVLWSLDGDPLGSVVRSGASCAMRSVAFHRSAPMLAASGPCELVAWSLGR